MILGFGAVMMLGGRQSGETISSALPEPILNVDMLIVAFKFLPHLRAYENIPSLYYRRFEVLDTIFRKVYSLFMTILPLA